VRPMGRLNVYLPDDIAGLAAKWRGTLNLSEICTEALRAQLGAAETGRTAEHIVRAFRPQSALERALMARYDLAAASVCQAPPHDNALRETIGRAAAAYLGRILHDDVTLGVGGGRQMWSVVQALAPRSLRLQISALGLAQNDPVVLHAHPNTLVTLIWLLCAPRGEAHLVGAKAFDELWTTNGPPKKDLRFCVACSCSPLQPDTPFANLLGSDAVAQLQARGVRGDYAYQFLDRAGNPVLFDLPDHASMLAAPRLQTLARRSDARVMLIAGGREKVEMMRLTLGAGLCNVLVTDDRTASVLVHKSGGTHERRKSVSDSRNSHRIPRSISR